MTKNRKYEDHLMDQLKDPKLASEYLNACLEDGDVETFLLAVRDVVKANKSMKVVAEEVGVNRESMYNSLSKSGNPRIKNLFDIIHCLGLDISFKPKRRRRSR
jgi:probable addiction module antidote protein